MHSKRTHALKPRRFVTMWSGRKMEQSKILTNLVTFATAAKYLTEGLNKYICGGQLIHYTQPNPRFRTTKSVCRIQVQPNPSVISLFQCLSLYLFFFDPFFSFGMFAWCTVILNKNPFFENITKIYKLQSFDRSARYIQLHASLLQPKQI